MNENLDSPTYDAVCDELGVDPAEIERESWSFKEADARVRAELAKRKG